MSQRSERHSITFFLLVTNALGCVAFIVGWLKGGHPERFGVAVLLFYAVAEELYRDWRIGGVLDLTLWVAVSEEQAVGRVVVTLIFGWLAFRSPRWWPLAITASLALIVLVHLLTMVTPVPYNAAASARVGLWIIVFAILLAGVAERWLAGEAPVSRIGRVRPRVALQGRPGP